jgi:hypothetical protein
MSTPISTGDTFTASHFTRGNLFFPTRSIGINQVASVRISTGLIWSDIVIESSGGTDPITSHGHRKGDAQRIRELIEGYQAARRT